MSRLDLAVNPVHLGLGASAQSEPAFTGSMDWYASYVDRHAADGVEGRLVSTFTFKEPWNLCESTALFITAGAGTQHRPR